MAKPASSKAVISLIVFVLLFATLVPSGYSIHTPDGLQGPTSEAEPSGSSSNVEVCDNLVDDDADGLVDNQDAVDCSANPLGLSDRLVIDQAGNATEGLSTPNPFFAPQFLAPEEGLSPESGPESTSQNRDDDSSRAANVTINQTSGMTQYVDSVYGFSIEYPPGWETAQGSSFSILSGPVLEIILPAKRDPNVGGIPSYGTRDAALSLTIENVSSYLDTDTLQLVNASLDDYVNSKIQEIRSLSSFGGGGVELGQKYLRHSDTTVAGNPAVKIEYTTSVGGVPTGYDTVTLMVKDNKLYNFHFNTAQLRVPQDLPLSEKMLESFKILNTS